MLTLSLKETDRLAVLHQLHDGVLTVTEAARRLRISRRHMRRLLRRYEAAGDASLPHRSRGRPSNRRSSEGIRTRALERARDYRASERREHDLPPAKTLIRKGLEALGIELIIALSPPAKGRVERLFGTLQDRLIKEMRIAGISSLEDANRFLEEIFIPFWNQRFTVEAASAANAHRPLPKRCDLLALFAEISERVIRPDFTFRLDNQHYQIEKKDAAATMPGSSITIERRLDQTLKFRWRGRYLKPTPIALPPSPVAEPRPRLAPPSRKPAANHPWRKPFAAVSTPLVLYT